MLKNASLCKSLIYALLLLWLTLTGSYEGWQVKAWLAINGYLSAIALMWGGWQIGRNGAKPLTWPLITFWVFGVLVSALSRDTASIARIFFWAILIAVYHIPHDHDAFRRGARWVGWALFPLATISHWENPNSMAMLIWGLYWLGVGGRSWWFYSLLAGGAMLTTASEGGYLAVLAGIAIWLWLSRPQYRRWLTGALIACLGSGWLAVLMVKVNNFDSFWKRGEAFQYAWAGFLHSPVIGNGLNTYDVWLTYWHAIDPHNLILGILWETGLIGLGLSLWLTGRLLAQHRLQPWAAAWLVTFFSHSLVDLPLYASFFTAVTLFIILGGLPGRERAAWPWPWPKYRPQGAAC